VLQAVKAAPNRPRIIALDLPTGVDTDTGAADEATLTAEITLTFGYVKRGLLLYPARAHCGTLRVIDIGLPQPPAVQVAAWEPAPRDVARWLPRRQPTMQKYSAGAVLALAGSPRYVGAPVLSCSAAMRAGAGYVTLATTEDALPWIATHLVETTFAPLPGHGDEGPGPDALARLQELASRYRALLVGPGLGRAPRVVDLVRQVLSGALHGPRAALVDADALYALTQIPNWPKQLGLPIVLTPHTGELARLTGMESRQIEADRFGVAARYAQEWGQVLVLKGGPTIVASPTGALSVNPTGNALLATAGSGDVLSGVIAAFLAGGADPFDAARAGVYAHGLAADLAAGRFGDRGMVAGDLLPLLPEAIASILANDEPATT
jgi:NAD(P)H-hydrate epimerase